MGSTFGTGEDTVGTAAGAAASEAGQAVGATLAVELFIVEL